MSWRTSIGRDRCAAGMHLIPAGALVYIGTYTPTTWCEAHALSEFNQEPSDSVVFRPVAEPATGLDRLTRDKLHALLMKHAPAVAKTWSERE